jgi:hypothetical protein
MQVTHRKMQKMRYRIEVLLISRLQNETRKSNHTLPAKKLWVSLESPHLAAIKRTSGEQGKLHHSRN